MKKLGELLMMATAFAAVTAAVRSAFEWRIKRFPAVKAGPPVALPKMDREAKELQREMVIWLTTTDGLGPEEPY